MSAIQVRFLDVSDEEISFKQIHNFEQIEKEDVKDTHICGRCRSQFSDLDIFLAHKDKCRIKRGSTSVLTQTEVLHSTVSTQTEVFTRDAQVETVHSGGLPKSKGSQTYERRLKGRPLGIEYFTDHLFKSFTGVCKGIFAVLKSFLDEKINAKNKDTASMLQLFLVKCKLCLTYRVMGGMFSITEQTAAKWFKQVMFVLYFSVKDLIIWFNRDRIRARMPADFRALYPQTRVIIGVYCI